MNQVSLLPKMKLWPQTENWFKSKGEGKNLPSVTRICSQEQKQEESHTLEVKGSPGLSVNNSFRFHLRKMRQRYDFLENRPPTWSFTDWVREQAAFHNRETQLKSSQSRFGWLHITYSTDNRDLSQSLRNPNFKMQRTQITGKAPTSTHKKSKMRNENTPPEVGLGISSASLKLRPGWWTKGNLSSSCTAAADSERKKCIRH